MADRYEEIARKIVGEHARNATALADLRLAIAAALREQDTWYEIDDPEHPAPRDGTPVLVWGPDPDHSLGFHPRSCWWSQRFDMWVVRESVSEATYIQEDAISHWRPLPPPPQSVRQDG
jgi:hypothetical protein